tara:strand:- start:233 stop:694 length:462 start_codon:yes stop_codon:yes gene_type:complete
MGTTTNSCQQKNENEFIIYNDFENNYSIKYPINWKKDKNSEGIVSIEPLKMKGGIYISVYKNITLPEEKMVDFILETNNLTTESEKNILKGEENGIKSWYISYTDSISNLTCMSAYKSKGHDLWFITTEIEKEEWNNGWKEKIVEILQSFTIK